MSRPVVTQISRENVGSEKDEVSDNLVACVGTLHAEELCDSHSYLLF
jgi:hypothetical protein